MLKLPLRATNVLHYVLSFNELLIYEGCCICEVLVGFKPTPIQRSEICNSLDSRLSKAKYLVLEMYCI